MRAEKNSEEMNGQQDGVRVGDYMILAGVQDGSTTFDLLCVASFEEVKLTHQIVLSGTSIDFAGLGDSISQFRVFNNIGV